MINKVTQSLEQQKLRLSELLTAKDDFSRNLAAVTEQIAQVRGAIATLDYVRVLLDEEAKDEAGK